MDEINNKQLNKAYKENEDSSFIEYGLTTVDNPYDVFTQFDQWFLYDISKGYYTCSYLGRVVTLSERYSDEENFDSVGEAIDTIIALDPFNLYKKVSRKVSFDDIHQKDISHPLSKEDRAILTTSIALSDAKQASRRNRRKDILQYATSVTT